VDIKPVDWLADSEEAVSIKVGSFPDIHHQHVFKTACLCRTTCWKVTTTSSSTCPCVISIGEHTWVVEASSTSLPRVP
jgi:hypothetical protein